MLAWLGMGTICFASAISISLWNLHHYILDGDIWNLRKPDVAKSLNQ